MNFHTRKWVKPEDLNPNGTLFGGSLLRWIDEEAAIYAIVQLGNQRVVTKYISEINFVSASRQGFPGPPRVVEAGSASTKAVAGYGFGSLISSSLRGAEPFARAFLSPHTGGGLFASWRCFAKPSGPDAAAGRVVAAHARDQLLAFPPGDDLPW